MIYVSVCIISETGKLGSMKINKMGEERGKHQRKKRGKKTDEFN